MQRIIPISINIKDGTSDSQIVMYRGDNVKFQFNFTDTGSVSLDTATKMRVQVKPANDLKANYVWFAGETPITLEDYSIEFTSSETSGYAGNGFLAVLLLDSNDETVCTAGIPFRVEPSGYDGVFSPSEDFRDETLDAKNQAQAAAETATAAAEECAAIKLSTQNYASQTSSNATKAEGYAVGTTSGQDVPTSSPFYHNNAKYYTEQCSTTLQACNDIKTTTETYKNEAELAKNAAELAKTQAQEISDPENRIGNLQLSKLDNGILYFSGGSASATPSLAFDTLSVLFKTDFDFSVEQTSPVFFPFYVGKTTLGKFIHVQYGNNNTLRALINGVIVGLFNRADIAALVGDGLNALAFVFKKLSDGNIQTSLFVNGVGVQNRATATVEYPTLDSFLSINRWGTANVYAGTVGYSDFCILNFDVSAADAPYSLAEYQKGKRLPPFLSGVQLALGNYTIARNATTKLIKDASGNGNDATVSGNVAGDMDTEITAVVDELKTQISQQSTNS